MKHGKHWTCVAALGVALLGCEQQADVNDEMTDLQEARKNAPQVAQDLRQQLEEAKAQIARLEEKLTLAQQGITDEVVAERRELEQALKDQRKAVESDIGQAKDQAQKHNVEAEKAASLLEETKGPAEVDTQVKTDTEVVQSERPEVETTEGQTTIPVRKTLVHGVDEEDPDASVE